MPEPCPVCDRVVEHVRIEEADGSTPPTSVASFEIDDLCSVEDDTRWDRICTVASVRADGGAPEPVLEIHYHFFEEGE